MSNSILYFKFSISLYFFKLARLCRDTTDITDFDHMGLQISEEKSGG
jgi:hypothetical protein